MLELARSVIYQASDLVRGGWTVALLPGTGQGWSPAAHGCASTGCGTGAAG